METLKNYEVRLERSIASSLHSVMVGELHTESGRKQIKGLHNEEDSSTLITTNLDKIRETNGAHGAAACEELSVCGDRVEMTDVSDISNSLWRWLMKYDNTDRARPEGSMPPPSSPRGYYWYRTQDPKGSHPDTENNYYHGWTRSIIVCDSVVSTYKAKISVCISISSPETQETGNDHTKLSCP